jgi:hypothetical protein
MLNKDFKEFLKLLNNNKVEYLLVGGYAVILHGYPRYTGDIDFWIHPTNSNAKKIIEVLNQFGFGSLGLTIDDFTKPDQIIQLGNEPFRIDLITSVEGVDFEECFSKRVVFNVDDIAIQTIDKEMLKKNKKAAGRHKDLDDYEHL